MNNNRKCFGVCKETERLEEELYICKKALEKACNELDCSYIENFAPCKWVCDNEDWQCDRRCEYKSGKFKGSLSFDAVSCWRGYFMQKAREEIENNGT